MGKKQHSKDRMFITKTEWATEWGGAKSKENRTPFKRLPFYCCAYASLSIPIFALYLIIFMFFFLIFFFSGCLIQPYIHALWVACMHEGWQRLRFNVGIFSFRCYLFQAYIWCNLGGYYYFFIVFWCRNIVPYIRKYGKHPVTGAPLKQEDLINLTFHKNSEG